MPNGGEVGVWYGAYAVVYSYNRKDLLARCIEALNAQTVLPDRLIVVDNGCTDGTREFLAERGLLDNPRLEYVRLEQNTGAAGGLRAGVAHAFRRGCAWAWVMDDDVICTPTTLAELKRAYEENFGAPTEIGYLMSRIIDSRGLPTNTPHVDQRPLSPDVDADWDALLHKGLVKVRMSALSSVLLPRSTLEHCGTPSSDFYMWGEDFDYTLRVTDWRPAFLVGGSVASHLRSTVGVFNIFRERDPQRIANFYYFYRNLTYIRWRHWPPYGVVLFLTKALLHFLRAFVQPDHRLLRLRTIAAGTIAGLFFRPRENRLSEAADHQGAAGSVATRVPANSIG